MNNEFTYYKVEWLEADLTGFYNVKSKKVYFKDEAFEYKKLVENAKFTKNCVIKKIIEKTQIIS